LKTLAAVLAVILLLGCGGSTSPSGQGTAYFTIDQASCAYSGTKTVTFYIADLEAGTESLLSGATSLGYLTKATNAYTSAGNPVVHAKVANYAGAAALWTQRTSITVPANGSVTHAVKC
jgi:hypothetical protein